MRVLHLVPSLAPHDAIGTHTRLLHEALLAAGIDSEIVADEALDGAQATPFAALRRRRLDAATVVWYQASTTSPMAAWVRTQVRARRLLTYHNVTPWQYQEQTNVEVARALWRARGELTHLAPAVHLASTVSRFNARDLRRLGVDEVRILPPLIELGEPAEPAPARPSGSRWIFVGRLVPHKRQDRLIAALAIYRRTIDPSATLALVGKATEPSWRARLVDLAAAIGVEAAVEFIGDVDESGLRAEWREASVYVSASDHEGFGFPLIEAMSAGVPVVALARGAVAETIGRAGLLVTDEAPRALAEAVALVEHDTEVRSALSAEAARRRAALDPARVGPLYRALAWEAAG
ncbi:glycosyl transferase group 1 [Acidimicrobium ferrooxidans DSM 10331]|uniref:Glycosyl transferase group 1 n=1 Tax=Acidimicrobium ferrooxidans (strain DSM 10331 / JCM 15462 / NBRC 103882 / ICP) TaxID=525909 RepID=C7M102_ACIFD|nr:glycosyltransferase family 4 protein [Acidimicrobium ferrooxidans]ACU54660.1 glycosyl transferase group 1 [Acidimicrobium ferrooxidans DSM 10331]